LTTPSDRWLAAEAYESFMGRWSRQVAALFLDWLATPPRMNWLDVGCGTGALSEAICSRSLPQTLVGCDPSPDFVSFAGRSVPDCPATFVIAGADNLPTRVGGFDVIVSGLVLNFLPQPLTAVQSMSQRLRPGGTLAAYVWDYSKGMQFLRVFWDEAIAVDPSAADLDEARRFPLCRPEALAELFTLAGLQAVATIPLQIQTTFPSFDDFWSPLQGGTGPAPSFVGSLKAEARDQLASRLKARLRPSSDGAIRLGARAFGVRGNRTS
jgi:trans-aconitate methyltransferase